MNEIPYVLQDYTTACPLHYFILSESGTEMDPFQKCMCGQGGWEGGFGLVVRLAFKMQNGSALGHVLFCS